MSKNRTLIITGASRGIGKAIALKAAQEQFNLCLLGKSLDTCHPKLQGTLKETQLQAEALGSKVLSVQCDVRDELQIQSAVNQCIKEFSSIDILVNNAGAIDLSPTSKLASKRWDLMHQLNARAPYLMAFHCFEALQKSSNAHIINLCPPISLDKKWFARHAAYTISKYSMSMLTLGMSEEFKQDRIAVNALWPKTLIATAAVKNIIGGDAMIKQSRFPEIVSDACSWVWNQEAQNCSGNFFIDEEVLKTSGITDFKKYQVDATQTLRKDLYID